MRRFVRWLRRRKAWRICRREGHIRNRIILDDDGMVLRFRPTKECLRCGR